MAPAGMTDRSADSSAGGVPRSVGALVLALILIAAVAVTRLTGPATAGQAVIAPMSGRPNVGDCMLNDPVTLGIGRPDLPAATFGPCAGPHYGEIVLVVTDLGQFPRTDLDSGAARDPSACEPSVDSYLGIDPVLPDNDRGPANRPTFGRWRPIDTGHWALVGPGGREKVAGQQWVACVSFGNAPASGSVRDMYGRQLLPNSYATCRDVATGADRSCAKPHQVELFGESPLTYDLPGQDLMDTTCRELVGQLTGLADLTAGGRLAVTASVVHYDVQGRPHDGYPADLGSVPMSATCLIRASGPDQLVSTLFGVRDGPLPLQ